MRGEILASGRDDWVHIVEMVMFAREAMFGDRIEDGYPNDVRLPAERLAELRDRWTVGQERIALPLAIAAVKELLNDGLVRIGETVDRGFRPWVGTPDAIEGRIDRVAEEARYPLLPGCLFWLEVAPEEKISTPGPISAPDSSP